jgi:hypothetical protein
MNRIANKQDSTVALVGRDAAFRTKLRGVLGSYTTFRKLELASGGANQLKYKVF